MSSQSALYKSSNWYRVLSEQFTGLQLLNFTLWNIKFNIVAIFSRWAFDKALFNSLLITHIIFLTHLSNRKKSRMVCMTNIRAQNQCYVSMYFQTRIYSNIICQKQCEWAMVRIRQMSDFFTVVDKLCRYGRIELWCLWHDDYTGSPA